MGGEPLAAKLDGVIAEAARVLSPRAFRRRRATFVAVSGGIARIIEFQRSVTSNRQRLEFTINLGVVCRDLLDPERADLECSGTVDAHLRTRLGQLLEPPAECWWTLTEASDLEEMSREIAALLLTRAAPYLEGYRSPDDLIRLWECGIGPGLTEGQRASYLRELKRVTRSRPVGSASDT